MDDDEEWEDSLRDVAMETFAIVSSGDRCIDVVEFQRWLSKGWKETKLQFES